MIDLNALNPQQRAAVEQTEGPLLVLAGAGSGKTRVLTYRVAYLMERGVAPWHILAITFTNKAAREMAERVHKLAGEASEDAWISTFHSCCARILRRDIEKLGYKRQFAIYDEDDRMSVIKAVAKELKLSDKEFPPKQIRAVISDAKNRLLTPTEWLKESGDDFRSHKLYEAYRLYEQQLKGNNALDFDDLLIRTLELLTEQPPVLEYYRDKFRYILVDEYQDTNAAQYMLVRLLAGDRHNLCVVGDDDQSIYGWRGADLRNILDFEKDFPECVTIKLEQNYRSTGNILDAANQVIAHNAGRKEKALWTEAGAGERIRVYRAQDEREEAAWVCQQMNQWKAQGGAPGDAAVLYRANAQSRVLEEALVRAGLPYRVYGGMKFYERKEVKDLIAYLRALVNPADDMAVRRIINEPRRGIGDTTVDKLAEYAAAEGSSLFMAAMSASEAGLTGRALSAVEKFSALMEELTVDAETMPADGFLRHVIEATGYEEQFKKVQNEENESRLENIAELETAVKEYVAREPEGGLEGFLENVALVTDLDGMDASTQALTLMTLHSAKGLEFDLVVMTGMEEGVFPTSRALFDDEKMEEERRLCYVGITRARKRLLMSWAQTRALYGSRQYNTRSRFLDEVPRRLVEDANIARRPQTRLSSPQAASGFDGMRRPATRESAGPEPVKVAAGAKGLDIPGVAKGFGIPGVRKGAQAFAQDRPAQLFKRGDRVRHSRFGEGTVLLLYDGDKRMTIRFDDGTEKTFAAELAPVVRVEEGT